MLALALLSLCLESSLNFRSSQERCWGVGSGVIFEIKWNHDGNAMACVEKLRVTPELLLAAPPLIPK